MCGASAGRGSFFCGAWSSVRESGRLFAHGNLSVDGGIAFILSFKAIKFGFRVPLLGTTAHMGSVLICAPCHPLPSSLRVDLVWGLIDRMIVSFRCHLPPMGVINNNRRSQVSDLMLHHCLLGIVDWTLI